MSSGRTCRRPRSRPSPYLHKEAKTPQELLAWHDRWYRSLDDERRARLCCVMSHWAGYLLPALDRPAEALVMVREPVDRTLSYYWFKQRRRGPERPLEPLDRLYELRGNRSDGEQRPALLGAALQLAEPRLLSVFHDTSELAYSAGPSADAELWRERLRELVGRVYASVSRTGFAEYLGVARAAVRLEDVRAAEQGQPRAPGRGDVSAELRETILAHNWLDSELYELANRAIREPTGSGRT